MLACFSKIFVAVTTGLMLLSWKSSSLAQGLVSSQSTTNEKPTAPQVTLRDFLLDSTGFHLAMGPAFFGFYAYFGALTALNEETLSNEGSGFLVHKTESRDRPQYLQSVGGASAGAMAAGFLAAGCNPRAAADFACSLGLASFADPPGLGGILRGRRFQSLLEDFLESEVGNGNMQMEDTPIPVSVSAYDIRRQQHQILTNGPLARAMRASATFPVLFQPVSWNIGNQESRSFLIDGGVTDKVGLQSICKLLQTTKTVPAGGDQASPRRNRILNLNVGAYEGPPPGPSDVPGDAGAVSEMVSMAIQHTPRCSPLKMKNGPYAFEAARLAVSQALDQPMNPGKEPGHYELHLDASAFVSSSE